jgi:hypothetical protein
MSNLLLFGMSVGLSFLAWGTVSVYYFWPRLRRLPLSEAARPILLLNVFRFMGAAFLIPGVAGVSLDKGFAVPVAYGDLGAVALAWIAVLRLGKSGEKASLWVFNIWGTADLLNAFYLGLFGVGIPPSSFGATFFIPTVYVPLLLISHAMLFSLLMGKGQRPEAAAK